MRAPITPMNEDNLVLMTDSYKLTHWMQYKEGTTRVYSYLESRGGSYPATVFYGLQYILRKYLSRGVTLEDINEAQALSDMHISPVVFNRKGWEYILSEYGGKIPLHIKAVPEGTLVPVSNVLMSIDCEDPKAKWLVDYFETLLLQVWGAITVATNSFYSRGLIDIYAKSTGSDPGYVDFGLHDFGYRGTPTKETASLLGSAHLLSFKGTDTLPALTLIHNHYHWDRSKDGLPGYSVPASQHSIATPFGRDGEKEYVLNMLNKFPSGIVSVVGDSYDIKKFAVMISTDPEIKQLILERDGRFVLRPDSGDPVEIVGHLLDILWSNFGGTYTDKHFKVLNPHIRIIQGDGIDHKMIGEVLKMMLNNKYASENVIFGSGGGLLQKFDRDTQKFAIKCSYAIINGEEVNVQKDPVTSSGKKSKRGMLKLHDNGCGRFSTISSASETQAMFNSYTDALETVFLNGEITKEYSFTEIRNTLSKYR